MCKGGPPRSRTTTEGPEMATTQGPEMTIFKPIYYEIAKTIFNPYNYYVKPEPDIPEFYTYPETAETIFNPYYYYVEPEPDIPEFYTYPETAETIFNPYNYYVEPEPDIPEFYTYPETAETIFNPYNYYVKPEPDIPEFYTYPETAETIFNPYNYYVKPEPDIPEFYTYPETAETIFNPYNYYVKPEPDIPEFYTYPETAETIFNPYNYYVKPEPDIPEFYTYPETAETIFNPYNYYPESEPTIAYYFEYNEDTSTIEAQPTTSTVFTTSVSNFKTLTTKLSGSSDSSLSTTLSSVASNDPTAFITSPTEYSSVTVPTSISAEPPSTISTTTKRSPVRVTGRFIATRMYAKLLNGYDPRIRPVQNQSKPVYVNTQFVPMALIEFDTFEQRLSMLAYFRIRWTDEQLMWRPKRYGYIAFMRTYLHELWTPNIILHKSFDGHGGVGSPETDILMISWNGIVQWVPEATYSVVCDVDIQYFPFDEQTCTVTYYAADETVDTVELDHYLGTDMSEYSENPSWVIVGASRKRYIKDNNWYIDVEFRLQRRANFATFTLITPLMMLAFLNICVFLVPIDSGEKGSFSVTIFLSYGIFFTVVSDTLPQNSLQLSFFILLVVVLLCLSVVSVFYTVIQAKLVSAIGSKQCPITCLRNMQRMNVNKVTPIEHYIETGRHDPEDESYTWEDFLKQLDTFLFVSFLIAILLIAAIFFAILMRHVGTAGNMFDTDPETTTRSTPLTTVTSA
ncbi:uncharacterized protein LOC128204914 [Mya arenaria]|uniref:uncharacterized protein LOC128204914 n=1 Tax=Mya arenaria TaxID=6604 RepID=UPI0022E8468E|nr:uncharacterized protein LOC128204914 [Mya arenaria]